MEICRNHEVDVRILNIRVHSTLQMLKKLTIASICLSEL